MQIVTDIDDDYFEYIKHDVACGMDYKPCVLIAHGTPLPEGHGKIIDADKIGLTDLEILMCDGNYKEALKMLIDKIDNAQPIIEADKAGMREEIGNVRQDGPTGS